MGDITVNSCGSSPPDPELSEWSFRDRDTISIDFEYIPSDGFGNIQTVSGTIEIRKASGLLFVISDDNINDVEQIIRELRRVNDDGLNIKKRFIVGREKIWSFLLSGCLQKAEVITPFGGVQRVNLGGSFERTGVTLDDARESYPVELAVIEFEHDSNTFDVKFLEDKLDIESSRSQDIEYVIQAFESAISG